MNKRIIWAIARKDMRAITSNTQVWAPMIIVPLLLGLVIPTGMVLALSLFGLEGSGDMADLVKWLERLPPSALTEMLAAMPSVNHRIAYLAANYLLAPFFLMIPLMAASSVAADSFAGEKERGTLESLLFAPIDMGSFFAGKVAAAFLPAVGLSVATFTACMVTVNLAGWKLFGGIFFPSLNWLPLILLVVPAVSLAAIFINVFISARAATFQAAYQTGSMLVLPAVLLIVGQASGLLLLETGVLVGAGLVLLALDALLLRMILGRMNRNQLFESQIR